MNPSPKPRARRSPAVRTLTLLRHAKSSWKEPGLPDIERPLNKRGRRAADEMAGRIVAAGGSFAVVLASPARRTRETLARMWLQLPAQDAQVVFDHSLYTFEGPALLDALRTLDDSLHQVMVVGHNPALEEAMAWLLGRPVPPFPTAACAQLAVRVAHWADLHEACADLQWWLEPADGQDQA